MVVAGMLRMIELKSLVVSLQKKLTYNLIEQKISVG